LKISSTNKLMRLRINMKNSSIKVTDDDMMVTTTKMKHPSGFKTLNISC